MMWQYTGYISGESINVKSFQHPNVHGTTYNGQDNKEEPKGPSANEWIKMGTWIYNGILYSRKSRELMPFAATWIPRDYYTK